MGSINLLKIIGLLCLLSLYLDYIEMRPQYESIVDGETRKQESCGYKSCPKTEPNMLNVHLVAHTHDDVGWLKTIDQYYYGSRSLIQKAGVQYILDSVVQELLSDERKRFIYVESAFFFKWWEEQNIALQNKVTQLINEGRLEFIGGAWSMNDEATTYYQSVIDQFSWGLRRLNDTFGKCARPRIGWQIDPFGHSREMASMFAQMGFDGLFFGRLDYQDKQVRLLNKRAEMIWRASANLDEAANLFTGALYNQYQPPPGFCFDILCSDEPIIDGPYSPDNNVNKKVSEFLAISKLMAKSYRANHILITMGNDFTYQDAHVWYKNLDKLIKYANARQANGSNINLLYSTPSCYLKALHEAKLEWPTKDDDFFPYASDPHAYWTGYFTSRPTIKRYERVGNHFLQVCKQLTAAAPELNSYLLPHLNYLREIMGVMQHHDAVTGTEKQEVAFDYAKRLHTAIAACRANTKAILNYLTIPTNKGEEPKLGFENCNLLNISMCHISEKSDNFILTLYNPLSFTTSEYIRLPVPDLNYKIVDQKDVEMQIQYVPISEGVMKLHFRNSSAKYELVFLANDMPPLGYKSYYISKINNYSPKPIPDPAAITSLTTIGNDNIRLTFDTNGFLSAVTADGRTHLTSQEFLYYEAAEGNNKEFRNRSSGAYIFRPKTNTIRAITTNPSITVYKGKLVEEVHQKFNDWISQVVRVYRNAKHAEFQWLVGPIPVNDVVGKEIITRFNSDIKSQSLFYTDSNGREMLKRMRNHRDTWNVKIFEETAGNYYPITSKIALEDDSSRMALLNDRAQGGGSLADGSLEIMIHRRLLHDDAFGVEEALNETAYGKGLVAIGTHYLVMGSSQLETSPTTQSTERILQLQINLPTWKFLSDATNYTYEYWQKNFFNQGSLISMALPKNIHLLTLEPWHDNELLVRFEHIFEKDEDPDYSKCLQFNIRKVLLKYNIKRIRETTLDGNAWKDEHERLVFAPEANTSDYNEYNVTGKSLEINESIFDIISADEHLLPANINLSDAKAPSSPLENVNLNKARKTKLKLIENPMVNLEKDLPRDDEPIIDMCPMQIRTYVVYLNKY